MTKKAKEIYATQIRLSIPLSQLIKTTATTSRRSFNAQMVFLMETALVQLGFDPYEKGEAKAKGRAGMFTGHMAGERSTAERRG